MAYVSKTLEENGNDISLVTHSDTVIANENGETLREVIDNKSDLVSFTKTVNKYFTIIIDDVESVAITDLSWFESMNIKPAFGLRTDFIGSNITWDEVRRLYNLGYEIAYHGTYHSGSWTDDLMNTDITDWLQLAKENKIAVVGYIGPNGYPLPVASKNKFLWARPYINGTAYGGTVFLDVFANLGTIWLDTIEDTSSILTTADSVSDNQYLVLSWHCQNTKTNKTSLEAIINGLYEKGFSYLQPRDAVSQSTIKFGGLGQNSTFDLANGSTTGNYFAIAGNGKVRTNQTL